MLGLAALAFAAGAFWATKPSRDERNMVRRYVAAWERDDVGQMYALLDPGSRARTS